MKNISGPVTITDTQQKQILEETEKIGKIVVSLWIIGALVSIIVFFMHKFTTNFSLLKICFIFIGINITVFFIAHIYNIIASHNLLSWIRNKSDTNEKYGIK